MKKENNQLKICYWFRAKWVYNLVELEALAQSWTARGPQRPSTLVYIRWCPPWRHGAFLFLGNIRLKAAESDSFIPWFFSLRAEVFFFIVCETMFTILIRVKAAAWRFNQLDDCVLPYKAVYWSFTSPGKFPRPFIRPSKQIRRLLASLLYNGKQVSPTCSPSAALANFLHQLSLCLMQNFWPITYLSRGIGWLLCKYELVYYSRWMSRDFSYK